MTELDLERRMVWTKSRSAVALTLCVVMGLLLPADALAEFTGLPEGFVDEDFVIDVTSPTAFAWLPNGDMLIAEKGGDLNRAPATGGNPTELNLDLDVCAEGERGLLGVAVDPDFGNGSDYVYIYYTADIGSQCANRVTRFTLGSNNAVGQPETLIDGIPSPAPNHNAGDIQFDRNGLLYISTGDGANGNNARRLDVLNGKILRIERDGDIPAGNPFRGAGSRRCGTTAQARGESGEVQAEKKSKKKKRKARKRKRQRRQNRGPQNACQEIFATGLRNPFRIAFDPDDTDGAHRFYINDVGQGAWEEINVGQVGADYGWDLREGPCPVGETNNCKRPKSQKRLVNPIHAYKHQSTGCRSITGGAFVPNNGENWPDEFNNSYIYADFVCDELFRLRGEGKNANVQQLGENETATHLAFGPDGALYYAAFIDGAIRRITFSS